MFRKPFPLLVPMLLLILAGCAQESDVTAAAGSKSATVAAASPAAEAAALPVGQPGRTKTLEIVVTGVEKPTRFTRDPPAGHEYVVVKLRIRNLSEEAVSIGASEFGVIRDEKGNRASTEPSTGITTDPDTFGGATIAVGETFAGSLIFAIPAGMSQTELHYTLGYAPKPALRFEIRT